MAHHLAKHAIHVVLIVSALVMLQVADVQLGAIALVALLALCLLAFEGGRWLLHRRDAQRAAAPQRRSATLQH
ncbi:MAG: hypothetical protein IPG97_09850 [Microthrixaceae bacterium]|nr:hypothetical protein [Microthrixaceae bacterium]MCB0987577.1 hypothetical protein [Acidimicrobiales bacterium]